jgi:hypothetical protein
METVECGAGRTRSQTQEEGLARENSVAAMLLDGLCSLRDTTRNDITLLGRKKREGRRKKFLCDTKDVRRY